MVQRDWGLNQFFYLPVRPDMIADHEWPLLYVHHTLLWFFYPIWELDHSVFGGPRPIGSMPLLSLGGGPEPEHADGLATNLYPQLGR